MYKFEAASTQAKCSLQLQQTDTTLHKRTAHS